MAHQWHKGVLTASSWHGLETVIEQIRTAAELLSHGYAANAWPVRIERATLLARLEDNRVIQSHDERAIVAHYQSDAPSFLASVGKKYRPLAVEEWRALVETAVEAGATPSGAFALAGGSKLLATFQIDAGDAGNAGAVSTHLAIVDDLAGNAKLLAGTTAIRIVCANTLSAAMQTDGRGFAGLTHTASMRDRLPAMQAAIASGTKRGRTLRDLMAEAAERPLTRSEADALMDRLFPAPAEDASDNAKTRHETIKREAALAMRRAENSVRNDRNAETLATLWNGVSWIVDRHADGEPRQVRGGDRLQSMLLGERGKRIEEIQTIVEVFLRNGDVVAVPAAEAAAMGVEPRQVGRAVIADLLGGESLS